MFGVMVELVEVVVVVAEGLELAILVLMRMAGGEEEETVDRHCETVPLDRTDGPRLVTPD